ncbi:hypothetical protein [Oscillatoria salina]|uniref:hypothetical protein n=1 Tax=Oscillatoria salina TaxID=331517 RepID=UPI001CC9D1AB|nr:hypothetical protein [Oscillatoria salina]MBZ8182045.1 hypothetical protein [Oscillatoria salina IIICB1]
MKWVKYVLASAMATPFFITTKSGISQEIQALPQVPGIDISRVEYVPAEKNRSPQLEQAIIRHFGEEVLDPEYPTEYSYNIVDLNDDGYPEALVYVQTLRLCGTAGCPTLIFQGSAQGYRQLRYDLTTYGGFIVTPQKTNGWKDIVSAYRCPDNFSQTCYSIKRFNGREYPFAQVILRSTITGKVYLLLDRFHQLHNLN